MGAGAEDLLGDGHGGHGLRPACIEGQVGDRLDKLLLDGAILLGQAEVEQELLGAPTRGQRRDGHEAALLRRQLGAVPDLAEQDVVGEASERRSEVTEQLLSTRLSLQCHGTCQPL